MSTTAARLSAIVSALRWGLAVVRLTGQRDVMTFEFEE
jgi:hypothetical protein